MPAAPSMAPRRRNARVGPMVLPASGRKGRVPKWPLEQSSPAELSVWAELWRTPQAVAWEGLGWFRVVARYCRLMLAAEDMDKDALAEARQLEDRLGLTPKALRLLLWTIEGDGESEPESSSDGNVVTPGRWQKPA